MNPRSITQSILSRPFDRSGTATKFYSIILYFIIFYFILSLCIGFLFATNHLFLFLLYRLLSLIRLRCLDFYLCLILIIVKSRTSVGLFIIRSLRTFLCLATLKSIKSLFIIGVIVINEVFLGRCWFRLLLLW